MIEMNERRQDFELLQRFTRDGEQLAFAASGCAKPMNRNPFLMKPKTTILPIMRPAQLSHLTKWSVVITAASTLLHFPQKSGAQYVSDVSPNQFTGTKAIHRMKSRSQQACLAIADALTIN